MASMEIQQVPEVVELGQPSAPPLLPAPAPAQLQQQEQQQNNPSLAQQLGGWFMNHWWRIFKIFAILSVCPFLLWQIIELVHRKPDPWCTPNLTVSKDGKGNFSTITAAVEAAPTNSADRYCILIREGEYHENVVVGLEKINLVFVGEGSAKTILKPNQDAGDNSTQLITLKVKGSGFIATDLRIESGLMRGEVQTVALDNRADQSIFYRCSFMGQNHTLYASYGRQFYRSCYIRGRQYFISGEAQAVFQRCKIEAVKVDPEEIIVMTGQLRSSRYSLSGFIFHSCHFSTVGVPGGVQVMLGGLSGEYAVTVVMKSFLGASIGGWLLGNNSTCHAYYGEYQNSGPGSATPRTNSSCIKLIHSSSIASAFTLGVVMKGHDWLPSNIPHDLGL